MGASGESVRNLHNTLTRRVEHAKSQPNFNLAADPTDENIHNVILFKTSR